MQYFQKVLGTAMMILLTMPTISMAENTNSMMNNSYPQSMPMRHNPAMMAMPNMDAQMMQRDRAMQQQRMMQMMRQQNRGNYPSSGKSTDYGKMPMMMQQRHAMGQTHMAQMEKRLANIERLLQELVNIQKKAK